MVLPGEVDIKICWQNIEFYKNLGFLVRNGDDLKIDTSQLQPGSHVLVNVVCDVCGREKKIKHFKYTKNIKGGYYSCSQKCGNEKRRITNNEIYGTDTPLQNADIFKKVTSTNIKRYGVGNTFQSEFFKNKICETNIKKYGFPSATQNKEVAQKWLNTKRNNGIITSESSDEFTIYKRAVRVITKKNTDTLFREWNGMDYYELDYIKENLKLVSNDPSYPTIDHKISVLSGSINKIDPSIIGHINNLCITKRSVNSSKNYKTEEEYKPIISI